MNRGPVDLSPLDPTVDRERYEQLVRRIVDRALPELDRRAAAATASVVAVLAGWARPAIAAAAVIAILATATVDVLGPLDHGSGAAEGVTIVDVLELPAPLAGWLAEGGPPSISAVIAAAEGGQIP